MLNDLINQYCEILNGKYVGNSDAKFVADVGRKYVKIVRRGTYENSVHAFVDRTTGNVYKPASWAQPAKGARFNLNSHMDWLRKYADQYGGYLYRN